MQVEAVPPPRLGRYTLVRPLGAGGMAELFLARSEGIGGFSKLLALKRILPHKASNEKFVRMLLNEARLVAGLDHPNIAQVYDIGCEDGQYFFTMEYVHGADLRRVLHAAPGRRLQLANTLQVAIGVCAGLHHAHEARDEAGRSLDIVHRDVSPSNVIVSYQGAVKLVDFGVARAANLVSETNDGVIKGKHGYMSPEQCLGEPLTRRSDVFNVGILLWEMTVGRRLYKVNGDLMAMQRVVYVDAPRPSRYVADYPPELEEIVGRALARDPAKRYQTAEELQLDLEGFARDHRLGMSAVAMANEMQHLFRHRVDAWNEAQTRGRSLAEHLADVSADEPVTSTPDVPDLDEVLVALDSPAAVTVSGHTRRPGSLSAVDVPRVAAPADAAVAVATPPTAEPVVPAQRRSPVSSIVAAILLVAGVSGATWFVLHRHADTTRTASAAGTDSAVHPVEPTPPAQPAQPTEQPAAVGSAEAPAPADTPAVAEDAAPDSEEAGSDVAQATTAPARPSAPVSRPPRKPRDRPRVTKPEPAAKPAPPPSDDVMATRKPVEPVSVPPDAAPPPVAPSEPAKPPPGPRPGTMDPASVRATVRTHLGEIEACVSHARMEDRDLTGRVVLQFAVDGSGRVTGVAAASSSGAPANLIACMTRTAQGWKFAAPAGNAPGAFSYPFAF